MQQNTFRKDINGLRALAVMSVVLYHFNSNYLPGGFAGVDVFFVISGFLMTSIIFKGIENSNFSILKFFQARAKRIAPALVAVITIMMILGYAFFEPLTYQIMGKHGVSSLLFVSNIVYANESGYFDQDAFSKFFLHTWSLSVEWQFYIIYPIILVALSKFLSIKNIKIIVLALTILSLLLCIYLSSKDSVISYFMLYTRAWEMLFGGLAFLYPVSLKSSKKRIVEILGISLIILSFIIFLNENLWPSYNALLPVIGAYLCILSNNEKTLLSNIAFQKIGLWSYSIYLVHWPFIIFFKKINVDVNILVYFISIVIIAFVIFNTIEKRRNYKYGLLITFIMISTLSYLVSINGASFRVKNQNYKLSRQEFRDMYEGHMMQRQVEGVQYFNSNNNDFDYILIGNSHARHYFSYIIKNKLKVASFALDGCVSTRNYYSNYDVESCKNRYKMAVDFIKSHPNKKIIWSIVWELHAAGIPRKDGLDGDFMKEVKYFVEDTKESNSKIYLIADTQGSREIMFECLAKRDLLINELTLPNCQSYQDKYFRPVDDELNKIANSYNNVKLINASDSLCDEKKCKIIDGNIPIYTDNHHLSIHGADIVGSYIFNKIENN